VFLFPSSRSLFHSGWNAFREAIRSLKGVSKKRWAKVRARVLRIEQLETRRVFATAIWHNAFQPLDVDGTDRAISPLDVLVLVNEINAPRFSTPTGSLPRQVAAPTAGPYFDVDCDGGITPLDVLQVINHINSGGSSNYNGSGTGSYRTIACSPQLIEGTAFSTELSRVITLPDDSSAIEVAFQSPLFDQLTKQAIKDSFEIEITDEQGRAVSLPYAADYDASYNWSDGHNPIHSADTTIEGPSPIGDHKLTINLAGLPAQSKLRVTTRLVNNDGDDLSSVIIRGFEIVDSPTPRPLGSSRALERSAPAQPIQFEKLVDVSSSFVPSYGRTTLTGTNNRLATELRVTNEGSQAVTGQLIVAIENFSSLDVFAVQPDGFTPAGDPYWDLSRQLDNAPLRPGETVRSREIRFLNESGERFDYRLRTYGALNRQPTAFTSTPLLSIEAGKTYRYAAIASDPDNDALTHQLIGSPPAMTIDSQTGVVIWNTKATTDIGSHQLRVRAIDPFGLTIDQAFTINVVESLQNRPPLFVSDPVTEAIASSGFEITTVATGPQPAGVEVISGFRGPRLVSLNAGDQSVSVHAGQKNDRFDDTSLYSTGEPRPTGAAIDVGYTVDVGLPPFLVPGDRNEVLGMDQGDFNGDGILDLAVITARDESTKPTLQRNKIEITRMIGDGDGNFGSPLVIATIPSNTFTNSLEQAKNLRIADIDGDGRLDVMTLQQVPSSRVTIRGLGDGSFQPAVFTSLSTPMRDYRLVDLDQDGSLDIVGRNSTAADLGWMRGVGNGTFSPFVRLAAGGGQSSSTGSNSNARSYDFADIDNDGDLDIVNSQELNANIVVLLNNGSETFSIGATIAPVDPPGGFAGSYVIHVADFTGDGKLDIFALSRRDRVDLFIGNGTGLTYTHQAGGDALGTAGNMAGSDDPVDVDRDGDLDIILASNFNSLAISPQVLVNDGKGRFKRTDYPMADFPGHILATQFTNVDVARGAMFGDYNRDGVMDLSYFTGNGNTGYDFNGVGIRLGTRPGEFGATRTVGMALNFTDDEVHAADFNGDGKVDLLTLTGARMSLGNGDGTFQPSFLAASVARGGDSGVVADYNLDGIPDYVAVRNAQEVGGPRIYIATGNGDGTFDVSDGPVTTGSFYGYQEIRTADFNNDGLPDLIAKAQVERFIDVYLNDAANPGTFTRTFRTTVAATGVDTLGFTYVIPTGDFDSDGKIDFVTVDQVAGQPLKLQTFSGNGLGGFSVTDETFAYGDAIFGATLYYPYVLQSGDVNEDGKMDVVSFTSSGAIVHIGQGDGTFTSIDRYPFELFGQLAKSDFLIDFDEDGHLDFVQHFRSETIAIRRGNGDGTFNEPERIGALGYGDILTFADFDNDGHLDIASGMANSGVYGIGDVAFYYGTRNGLVDQTSVDLDGDGDEEILAVNEANDRLKIFVGDNLDDLNRRTDLLTGRAPQAVATGDLNGDGRLEIITANRAGRSISVFRGSLATGYTSTEISVGSGPIDVLARDVNGDGHTDVLVLDDVANALWVLSGSASGVLSSPVAIPLGDKPSKFTLSDVTNDGRIDAIITLPDSNRLMILSGIGFQPVIAPAYLSLTSSPSDVQVTDLNADGNVDLAVTLPDANVLSVLYGRGNNQYARAQNIAVGKQPTRVTLADADEDGRIDLIVANTGDNTASVIYNRFDPNEVYRYDSDAIDADNDTLTYAIVDGPGGLIINSQTGALLWAASPDQVGEHRVTISANDGRGGVATQSFKIDVQPARDNALPIIATEPNTKIGAGETFTYSATALDNDRDTLRYSLIDAPAGATIDPTSGKVTWDARADMALSFAPHGITSGGRVEIEAHPSLQPASLTAEGWFNLTSLTASNGVSNLIIQPSSNGVTYSLSTRFNNLLRLTVDYPGATPDVFFDVPFISTTNRWRHFALTIDDTTKVATILVDGVVLGTKILPASIVYTPTARAQVGDSSSTPTQAIIDNYRLWNVARTPAEIAAGLSQQFSGDNRIVLDYRFDLPQTLTVRDYSPAGNHGYRKANGLLPVFVPGLAETGSHPFTIGVEDGRGGFDQQSFAVDVLPELRGSIGGRLTNASNGNSPLAQWQLFIDTNGNQFPDPNEPQTTTNATGNYQFSGLLPGSYPVRVTPTAGFVTPAPQTRNVVRNQNAVNDIAIAQLALSQIQGKLETEDGDDISYWKVYADLDNDSERDPNEPMAMSDRAGNYALSGLNAGTYRIRTETPAGWTDAAGRDGLLVTLAANAILSGNNFTLEPTNTSVTGGVHFVTTPASTIEARQTFRYPSIALGITSESIVYDLSLAPDGMTIDPATGLTAWRPTIAQVGEHTIIIRATNASGSIALHDFTLQVTAPNTPPVIVRGIGILPVIGTATVNRVYSVDVIGQDAESTSLSYALTQSPTGATIDSATGRIRWTPTAMDVGSVSFTASVADPQGALTTASWTVNVSSAPVAELPLVVSLPRIKTAVSTDYFSRITATDQLGRPVAWSLGSGPSGLTVQPDGTIEWTPSNSQLGTQSVVLTAKTMDNTVETVNFTIEVVGRLAHATPVIESAPLASVSLGQTYTYDIQATDADRDALAYTLLESPIGMSLHPSRGTLRWTPAADQLGESTIVVQVSDPSGLSTTQEFKLKVSRSGGPPAITSIPPTEASIGTGYLYSIAARDAEGDPLTYRLLAAPAGMNIVSNTGVISWTPAAGQLGQQEVVIEVSDGIGGAVTQAFGIRVASGVPNLPPVIGTQAPRFGVVGQTYRYTVQATDPEGLGIRYSLGQSPLEMTIDPVTGIVEWTPTLVYVGKNVVTFIATDAGGASAVESFELDVLAANSQPTIASTAPLDVSAGATFTYQVLGRDTDRDQLTYTMTTAPAGATIDIFGKITWPTAVALIGSHNFTVRVTDPRGGVATQSFTLAAIADTIPPKVSLVENLGEGDRNNLPWQGPFIVYARAIDNVAIASLTLTANGKDIPLDAAGTAAFSFEEWGFQRINATARAVDTNGNIATKTISFDYDFPEGWDGAGNEDIPTVAITSPTDTAAVFGMVTITGTATNADFAGYKLSYRRIDDTTYTQFHESTTAVVNGTLGVWDTSLLINDEYVIRLEASSNTGVVNVVEHNVGLSGELKLGNFQLSFTDMVIPVAGIPIEITRVYDTLQADREGDFGYGWRLEYRNTDLRVGLPKSGLEDIGIYGPLRAGVKVYLNVPGLGRQGFTFDPDIRVLPGFGGTNLTLARPKFKPDRGVTSTLSTGTSGYLQVNEFGELYAPGGIPYNPASPDFGGAYVLTTREGVTYGIDGSDGKLNTATDRNGNQVYFSENGVSNDGATNAVTFVRDTRGRIIASIDPSQNRIAFAYDTVGNLVSVVDRNGNVTTYHYDSRLLHHLQSVVDPLGRTGLRARYDNLGRLERTQDISGTGVTFSIDPNNLTESVQDDFGRTSVVEYDVFGRVVQTVNPLGGIKSFEYDTNGNVITTANELNETTRIRRDNAGRILAVTSPEGSTTNFNRNAQGDTIALVDAIGNTHRYELDSSGNTVAKEDPEGRRTEYHLNQKGLVTAIIDPLGITTEYLYDSRGYLTQSRSDGGNEETWQYDSNGNVISFVLSTSSSDTARFGYEFDSNGNLTKSEYPDGSFSSTTYDSNNRPIVTTDTLGRRTSTEYSESGAIHRQLINGMELYRIDSNPASTQTTISGFDGKAVAYSIDALGRPVSRTQGDTVSRFEYDAVGKLTQATTNNVEVLRASYNSAARPTVFNFENDAVDKRFDALGRTTEEIRNGASVFYQYDSRGLVTRINFDGSGVSEYKYNDLGQIIEQKEDGTVTKRYDYEVNGQLRVVTDSAGQQTHYERDAFGSVVLRTDSNGNEKKYVYNESGLIESINQFGVDRQFKYDATGRLERSVLASGQTVDLVYNDLDQLVSRTYSDESSAIFAYNESGARSHATDQSGTTEYGYDDFGRLIERLEPNGVFIKYEYDELGRQTRIQTEGGVRQYGYDSRNRISRVVDVAGGETKYTYDANGNLSRVVRPNATVEDNVFDSFGSLIGTTVTDGQGQKFIDVQYQRDFMGRVVHEIHFDGLSKSYKYDANGNLVAEDRRENGVSVREIEYRYDSTGNRTDILDSVAGITIFSYDKYNRLVLSTHGSVIASYRYDQDGNLIEVVKNNGETSSYRWNGAGRLLEVVQTNGSTRLTESYTYSPDGLRTSRTTNGEKVYLLYDSNGHLSEILETYDSNRNVLSSATFAAGLVSETDAGSSYYPIQDDIGSIRFVTNSTGDLVGKVDYSSLGGALSQQGRLLAHGFAGELDKSPLGLIDLRARVLDTHSGRFLSPDLSDGSDFEPISQNPYVYAHNDGRNLTDPTGLSPFADLWASLSIQSKLLVGLAGVQVVGGTLLRYATGTIPWSGDTYAFSSGLTGNFELGLAGFTSEAVNKERAFVVALTISQTYGVDYNLIATLTKRSRKAANRTVRSNINAGLASGSLKAGSASHRSLLKDANALASPQQYGFDSLIQATKGDATVYSPRFFGLSAGNFYGAYVNAGASLKGNVVAAKAGGAGGGAGSSYGVAVASWGFAQGFSIPDSSSSVGIVKQQSALAQGSDIGFGFSLAIGISVALKLDTY
jgi:large repetitive protein